MVLSVGGSPEPIKAALTEGKPDCVLFVVSEGSNSQVEDRILPAFRPNPFQWESLLLSDHEDMGSTYQEIRQGVADWLERRGIGDKEVAVDITGGTKPMAAALVLAAVERFSHFRYVGGTERDADNLGAVLTGSERVRGYRNPWNKYAVREMERAKELLDEYYADAAAKILEQAANRCDHSVRARIAALSSLVGAFAAADRFDFEKARNLYGRHRRDLEHVLKWPCLQVTKKLFKHWCTVREQTKNQQLTPSRETILELIANADRRAAQSRFDDAVGRLYRAVELHAQGLVKERFGAELGKLPLQSIPSDRQVAFQREYGESEDEIYSLGVMQLFNSLKYADDETPNAHMEVYDRLSTHLSIRNSSLFAHGSVPVTERMFTGFREAVLRDLPMQDSEIPRWPDITDALDRF